MDGAEFGSTGGRGQKSSTVGGSINCMGSGDGRASTSEPQRRSQAGCQSRRRPAMRTVVLAGSEAVALDRRRARPV
ncbi:hypothetical protein BS50DRAFT_84793 [Corynespora cassiicola Philippines]|uniref:Uncharacterized protein n=1 Tax=Corynespora cassiicola Philippines TaxID=1448308 RepID=A0A2T2NDU6_CORCC|nr:hypothetical protein BS50DRAFT_84793 [Corynespora cassiicola Philippines]